MRVEREDVFQPVTITLESKRELDVLASLFNSSTVSCAVDETTNTSLGDKLFHTLKDLGGDSKKYVQNINKYIKEHA